MKDRALKLVGTVLGIILVLFLPRVYVQAEEVMLPPERTNVEKIEIVNAEPLPKKK